MWLFGLFIAVPIIEITLFIQVGGLIGLWPTLAIVVLTAIIGTSLMRAQGIMTLNRLQQSLAEGKNPADPMAQGAIILVAGVLLLTPGFFTDSIGFALLIPPVRRLIIRWAAKRFVSGGVIFTSATGQPQQPHRNNSTIDAEYTVLDDETPPHSNHPSGWTKP